MYKIDIKKRVFIAVIAIVVIGAGSIFYACQKDGELKTVDSQVVKGDIPGYPDEIVTYSWNKYPPCYKTITYVQRNFDTHAVQKIYGYKTIIVDCNSIAIKEEIDVGLLLNHIAIDALADLDDDDYDGLKSIIYSFDSYIITVNDVLLTSDFSIEIVIEDENGGNDYIFTIDYEYIQTVHWEQMINSLTE